ncbi:MAG: protein translocase subunit SecF [Candidatus Gracilibacteria bacterium]|nr:protein translocase subunit SecF [Candidatus Gracilibacteria bacterium]
MKIDFIKSRFMYYGFALVLIFISLGAYFTLPLNLGIDMTGGAQTEYDYTAGQIDMSTIKDMVSETKKNIMYNETEVINNVNIYKISGENKFVVEAGFSKISGISDKDFEGLKTKFKDEITGKFASLSSVKITMARYINIGESFGDYIKKTAYMTLALVIIAISLYIAYAFRGSIEGFTSFSFASVTAISLFHDLIIAFGLYIIASYFFPEFKIDTFFITAMLTVLGYSINDTIVVMDRIRSNLRLPENKKKDFGTVINNSVNDTMTRSIYTSLTIFIVLVAMFFFGPDSIRGFILALIFGTIVGAYSSIAIAAPLLYDISGKKR